MTTAQPDLYYNKSGVLYPYQIVDLISITGNINGSNSYGYFYDWEVQPANCSSPRTPVTVEVIKAKITPRPEVITCEGNSIELTSSEASSYLWHPNGETTQSIMAVDSGQYTVSTLIGDCENTSLPVCVKYKAQNPQITPTFNANHLKVSIKTRVVKGYYYQFIFGDGQSKDFELPLDHPTDTIVYNLSHTYPQSGTYIFWQKITGECVTDSISLSISVDNTSIADNAVKNKLELFPNPSNLLVEFICPGNDIHSGLILLFDYTGRQILTQTLPPMQKGETVTIDLSNQPASIYLVRLKVGEEEFSEKVLLVK